MDNILWVTDDLQSTLIRIERLSKYVKDEYNLDLVGFGQEKKIKYFRNTKSLGQNIGLIKSNILLLLFIISNRNKYDTVILYRYRFCYFLTNLFLKKRIILDIDDRGDRISLNNKLKEYFLKRFYLLHKYIIKNRQNVIVSNNNLKKLYGGSIFYHVNSSMISEQSANLNSLKIIFAGTAYKHKGIGLLYKSLLLLNNIPWELRLTGSDPSGIMNELNNTDSRVKYYGFLNDKKFKDLFFDSNMVVLLQGYDDKYTETQTPAKVFDALAAGHLTFVTDRSDLKEILKLQSDYDVRDFIIHKDEYCPTYIAEKIEKAFLKEKSDIIKVSNTNKSIIREFFNDSKQSERLINIFNKLTSN